MVVAFWKILGVEADMPDLIAHVNPWWERGQLTVSGHLAQEPDAIGQVSHVLLHLCKWKMVPRFEAGRDWALLPITGLGSLRRPGNVGVPVSFRLFSFSDVFLHVMGSPLFSTTATNNDHIYTHYHHYHYYYYYYYGGLRSSTSRRRSRR